jgi:hypothetical protein
MIIKSLSPISPSALKRRRVWDEVVMGISDLNFSADIIGTGCFTIVV